MTGAGLAGEALPTWRAILTGPKAGLFMVLCFGVWLHAADSTVIATLLPGVVRDVGGEALISWNFVLYRLASITAACCAAIVTRIVGLRRTMICAAFAVALGCACSALTPGMHGMIVGRGIQGIGGGMLVACTMIGIASQFPSRFTPLVMAAISAVWGSSSFLGPLVGGIFAEYGHWRWGFWAFVGQALILAVALRWALPARTQAEATEPVSRIPWRRLSVLSLSILCIAVAGLERGNLPLIAGLCVLGIAGLMLFVRLDRRAADNRLLPRSVADIAAPVGVGFMAIFLIALASMPFSVYGPVLLDQMHGVGPLAAGYMIALESVAWTAGALIFAGLQGRTQLRAIQLAFLAMLVSTIGLTLTVTPGPVWAMLPFLFLAGCAFGTCFGHILQRCVEAAPTDDKDRAASAITTIQTIGYALGAAVSGLVANSVGYGDQPSLQAAQDAGFWIFAVMIPVALLALLLIRRLRA